LACTSTFLKVAKSSTFDNTTLLNPRNSDIQRNASSLANQTWLLPFNREKLQSRQKT